jgi:uncharacterized membrane protein
MRMSSRITGFVVLIMLALFVFLTGESASREIASLAEPGTPHKEISLGSALTAHLHNKAIHLPIGLAIVAFGLSSAAFKFDGFDQPARWCLLFAFAGAIGAVITGLGQAGVYEGGGKEWIVVAHRTAAYAMLGTLGVWTLFAWIRPLRVWAIVLGLVTMALVAFTGLLGGIIAHG